MAQLREGSVIRKSTGDEVIATEKFVEDSLSGAGLGDMLKSVYDSDNDGIVNSADTLNGLTATVAELNYVDGVTSAIQTQLNGKAPTSHASTSTTYGVASTSNYGHVKTSTGITNSSGTISVAYGITSETACRGDDDRLNDGKVVIGTVAPQNLTVLWVDTN